MFVLRTALLRGCALALLLSGCGHAEVEQQPGALDGSAPSGSGDAAAPSPEPDAGGSPDGGAEPDGGAGPDAGAGAGAGADAAAPGDAGPALDAGPIPTGILTVAEWEARYRAAEAQSWSGTGEDSFGVPQQCVQKFEAGNSRWAFDGWWCLNGPLHMFQATGKTEYLDKVLQLVEAMIAAAVPISELTAGRTGCYGWTASGPAPCVASPFQARTDSTRFKGWQAWGLEGEAAVNGGEFPLYEGQVWRHVTGVLLAMKDDPAVFADPAYRARFDAILAFTQEHLWNKWVARGWSNLYRVNTHMTSHFAFIALDLWLLSDASSPKRAEYRAVADNVSHAGIPAGIDASWTGRSFRTQWVPNAGDPLAYDLKWVWNDPVSSSEVGYANAVVRFVQESYERDPQTQWTAADLDKMRRALLEHIWTPAAGGWHFSDKVEGSGDGAGVFNSGWARLGRYDVEIQRRFEDHTRGRSIEMYGVGALNAAYLLRQK